MLAKTEAIVLNKIKYSDNSFVINFYSKELGKISALIRISSRKYGIKANIFSPLSIVEIEAKLKNTRSVQSVTYCNTLKATAQNGDISKLCILQFVAETILKMVKEEEPNYPLYNFFKETISAIEKNVNNTANLHIIFLKEFAKYMGFGIANNYSEESPYFSLREGVFLPTYTSEEESLDEKESYAFSKLLSMSYSKNDITFTYSYRKKIIEKLLFYYKIHTDNISEIKSLKVLNEVFTE